VEARLPDALHGKLTERFVNRRTAVLMKKLGPDAALLSVRLEDEEVLVEGAHIGSLRGFSFKVDPSARHADRKLLLAAAERHVPALLSRRAEELTAQIHAGEADIALEAHALAWEGEALARFAPGRTLLTPQLVADRALDTLPANVRKPLIAALEGWVEARLEPLVPLRKLEEASRSAEGGPALRALLIALVDAGGMLTREASGVDKLDKVQRTRLAKLGVRVGALDLFVPAMLRPVPLALWRDLARISDPAARIQPPVDVMPPVLPASRHRPPPGYRTLGKQLIRLDMAEKLLREAHGAREPGGRRPFALDPARAVSMGLTTASYARLLRLAGFQPLMPRALPEAAHGPPAPVRWRWRPPRRHQDTGRPVEAREGSAFAALAELVR